MFYCFLANGFEEIEAVAVIDILRRAELDIVTVGVGSKQVTGSHSITVTADIEEKDVTTDTMTGVILPGGMPGTLNLEKSPIVKAAVTYCNNNGFWVCAICAAPSILGHMGLLEGKQVTCFPSFACELGGGEHTGMPVTVDGNMITGKGPGSAVEFALEIVKQAKGQDTADKIRSSLQCP